MTLPTGPRDVRDAKRLAELEVVIDRGKAAFIETGEALLEIRESKLYRLNHETFEAYCKSRWGFSVRRGQQLMEAAETVKALPEETRTIVRTEGQAREIAPVPTARSGAASRSACSSRPSSWSSSCGWPSCTG